MASTMHVDPLVTGGSRAPATPPTVVAMLRWPAEAERRWELHEAGSPRLLLIARDEPVPRMLDAFEDWVWDGADLCEVNLRAETLASRWPEPEVELPTLEMGDVLRYHGGWAALSPAETKAVRLLLAGWDHCVSRHELEVATGMRPGSSALSSLVKRLRHRLAPLGLSVDTIHGRGYVLSGRHPAPAPVAGAPALRS